LICSLDDARAAAIIMGIPLRQDAPGFTLIRAINAGHHPARLPDMDPGACEQIFCPGLREFQLLEEDPVHLVGVVRPRVQDEVVQRPALPDHWSHLDGL
jgi:hypothetical protein